MIRSCTQSLQTLRQQSNKYTRWWVYEYFWFREINAFVQLTVPRDISFERKWRPSFAVRFQNNYTGGLFYLIVCFVRPFKQSCSLSWWIIFAYERLLDRALWHPLSSPSLPRNIRVTHVSRLHSLRALEGVAAAWEFRKASGFPSHLHRRHEEGIESRRQTSKRQKSCPLHEDAIQTVSSGSNSCFPNDFSETNPIDWPLTNPGRYFIYRMIRNELLFNSQILILWFINWISSLIIFSELLIVCHCNQFYFLIIKLFVLSKNFGVNI